MLQHVRTMAALALVGLLTASGCATTVRKVVTGPAGATPTSCPTPVVHPQTFPTGASSDLPRPTFAQSPTYLPVSAPGVQLLQFTTAMSLRDAVLFLLRHYPQAGYALGRGDAEVNEADAPFVHGTIHGTTRLSGVGPCTTTWLVATVTQSGGSLANVPQLAPHTASSSPLPFGG